MQSFFLKMTKEDSICCELKDLKGMTVCQKIWEGLEGEDHLYRKLEIENPCLWYPRTHGGQPLYSLRIWYEKNGQKLDEKEVKSGFRRIEQKGELQFFINGRPVRMWGSQPGSCRYHDRLLSKSPGKTV